MSVCSVESAGSLENPIRKLIQNPKKILKPYIQQGMIVLDLGCGPGFFLEALADLVGYSGKVIAADLQEGMLQKVRDKIKGKSFENKILLHKCEPDKVNLSEKVDFILMFYFVHEVPDQEKLFEEVKTLLKPNGKILIVEPTFHVSKKDFEKTLAVAQQTNLKISSKKKLLFSRAVILTNSP